MFPDNSYGHIHVTGHGTLQIQGVQKEDAGYFVCSALSVAGSVTIRAFLQVSRSTSGRRVDVEYYTFFVLFATMSQVTSVADVPPPIIQIGPTNQTLPLGGVGHLPCRATGQPTPRVKWYKDGMPLPASPQQRVVVAQIGSLKIDSTYGREREKELGIESAYVVLVSFVCG